MDYYPLNQTSHSDSSVFLLSDSELHKTVALNLLCPMQPFSLFIIPRRSTEGFLGIHEPAYGLALL